MRFIKSLIQDYKYSKQGKNEGFLEWFLKRKLSFWGKISFAILLSLVGLFILSNPLYILYLMYLSLSVSILVSVIEVFYILKEKRKKR